jgi:hypothetical protein
MRNAVTVSVVFCILTFAPLLQCQDQPPSDELFTPDQLDNMLAPVALYPDPLLAQLLVAATYPDQIDEAARFVRADSNPNDIDGQSWDVSVKSIAHYSTVLNMMDDQLDWTTALGQAYINQSDDVMASVQRLRAEAQASGNLQSNADVEVANDNGNIEIWPEQPQYIYVPEYDPGLVYVGSGALSFGPGFPIGAWLDCDIDWGGHQVVYHGWKEGKLWVTRSAPYVRPTGPYVNEGLRIIQKNRAVVTRNINYGNLRRYATVHPNTNFDNIRASSARPPQNNPPAGNKIIDRNVNTGDARINDFRGRPEPGQLARPPEPVQPPRQEARQPRQEPPRPAPPVERPAPSAFSGNQGNFNARESSQRGQQSRQEMSRPAPAPRPAPEPRAAPAPRPAPSASEGGKRR